MVADSAPSSANAKSDNACKIFVGGLAWEFTTDDLKEYFGLFGTVTDVTIKTDFATGNPRGFGFVVFDSKDAVDRVVERKNHAIKGKKVDPKKITEKEKIRKIFVGGVAKETPEEEVKTHFEQFGAVEEIVFPVHKESKERKGFCFITFVDPEACDAACSKQNAKQQVGAKLVDVKKAVPQEQMQAQSGYGAAGGYGYGYPAPGGRGGRGGARGGAGGAMGGYGASYGYGGYDQGYSGYEASGYDYGYGGYSTAYPGYGGADPYAGYGGYGASASASTSSAAGGAAGGKMRGGRGAGGRGAGGRGRGRGGPY